MSKISNYQELVVERKRIQSELRTQKNILKAEVEEIKEKFKPLVNVISFFGGTQKKDEPATTLLKQGSSIGVDFFIRDKLLGKAGWITRMLASSVIKGVLSTVISKRAKHNNSNNISHN